MDTVAGRLEVASSVLTISLSNAFRFTGRSGSAPGEDERLIEDAGDESSTIPENKALRLANRAAFSSTVRGEGSGFTGF